MITVPRLTAAAAALAAALPLALSLPAAPAHAKASNSCGSFSVTLPGGRTLRDTGTRVSASALTGRLLVRGTYVAFDVDPTNLAVYDYTMTGAPSDRDITGGVRTPVFAGKVPQIKAPLTGDLDLTVKDGTLLLRRDGVTKMKIQASDCAQGGIFQMEPEDESGAPTVITHTLAPGMYYFVNPFTNKVNFGNGTIFRGKDSPQVATRLSQTETQTVWSVASGGRMGGVLGEDAVELSAGATACVQDCQAQNRIQGSLPVPPDPTDPTPIG
jgi:hypothetical protein